MNRTMTGWAFLGVAAMLIACGGGGGGSAGDPGGVDASDPGTLMDVPPADPGTPDDLAERDPGGVDPGPDIGTDEGQDPGLPEDLPDDPGISEDATDAGSDAAADVGTDATTDPGPDPTADPGTDAATDPGTDAGCLEECRVENAHGTCKGEQRCGEPATCTAAVPAEEQCNGIDDDCDGDTDEGDLCPADDLACTASVCAGSDGCRQVVEAGWCLIAAQCHRAGSENPANPCEVCIPDAQGGAWQPRDGVCDDGNPCTLDDRCREGACVPGQNVCLCTQDQDCQPYEDGNRCNGTLVCDNRRVPHVCIVDPATVVRCDPSNDRPCLANRCDPQSGLCVMTPVDEGMACDDGLPCSKEDRCRAGVCEGIAYSCDDGLACTTDACDGLGGCSHDLQPYFCLVPDGDGHVSCLPDRATPPGDPCRTCDPRQDPLGWTYTASPCDDQDPCTRDDLCSEGTCEGQPYSCDDGLDCTAESCDGLGGCDVVLLPGFCLVDGACHLEGEAAPANPCLSCDPGSNPRGWTPNRLPCDDGNPCTTQEVCVDGTCRATAARNCDDGNLCTDDRCDPGVPGGCVHLANTVPCDDGNPCTIGDVCAQGACTAGSIQACDCESNADCPDDGDHCNGRPLCYTGVFPFRCVIDPSTVVECDASRDTPCLRNRCVPETGLCQMTPVHEGEPCNDEDPCTAGDQCAGGTCAGTPYDCDDLLDCTRDLCRGDGTCRHDLVPGFCLIGGTCVEAGAQHPDNPCLQCDPVARPYTWTARDDGTPCDDQEACTRGDACRSGQCRGRPYGCDDGHDCTEDACLGDGTCRHLLQPGFCLIDGVCRTDGESQGACLYCDPLQDPSQWTVRAGAPCDDGDPCTADDRCGASTGGCQGTAYDCDDGLWCTRDACLGDGGCSHEVDPLACRIDGTCQARGDRSPWSECLACWPERTQTDWTPLPDGLACSDNDECTVNDRCQGGACLVGPPRNCDDRNPCTEDRCDPALGCVNRPSDRLAIDFETPGLFEFVNSDPEVGWHEVDHPLGWPSRALYYGNPATGTYQTGVAPNQGVARTRDLVQLHPGDPAFLSFDLRLDNEWSRRWETFGQGSLGDADVLAVWVEFQGGFPNTVWSSGWGWPTWWRSNPNGVPIGPRTVRVSGIDLTPLLEGSGYQPFRLSFVFDTGTGAWNGFGGVVLDRVVIGQSCDDGDVCVQGESCQAGRCEGQPWDCDYVNSCIEAICEPFVGCQVTGYAPEGTPCEDYDRCTEGSSCPAWGGWCGNGSPVTCPDDQNECTSDRCDPVRGCVHEPVPDFQWTCLGGNGVCVGGECAVWTRWEDGLRNAGDWFTDFYAVTVPDPHAPLAVVGGADLPNGMEGDPIHEAILEEGPGQWEIDSLNEGILWSASDRLAVGSRFDAGLGSPLPWTATWVPGFGWSFLPERNPPLAPPDPVAAPCRLRATASWDERSSYLVAGTGLLQARQPYAQECFLDGGTGEWMRCATVAAFENLEPSCTLFQQVQANTIWTNEALALMGGVAIDSTGQRDVVILVNEGESRTACGPETGFEGVFVARDRYGLGLMAPSAAETLWDIHGTSLDNLWAGGSRGLLLKWNWGWGWQRIDPGSQGMTWDDTHEVRAVLAEGNGVHLVGTWQDPVLGRIPFYLHATLSWGGVVFDWRQDFPELAGRGAEFRDILRDPLEGDLVVVGSLDASESGGPFHLAGLVLRFGPP